MTDEKEKMQESSFEKEKIYISPSKERVSLRINGEWKQFIREDIVASLQQGWTDEDIEELAKQVEVDEAYLPKSAAFYYGFIKGCRAIQSIPPKSMEREGLFAEFLAKEGWHFYDYNEKWGKNNEPRYLTTTELYSSPEFKKFVEENKK